MFALFHYSEWKLKCHKKIKIRNSVKKFNQQKIQDCRMCGYGATSNPFFHTYKKLRRTTKNVIHDGGGGVIKG